MTPSRRAFLQGLGALLGAAPLAAAARTAAPAAPPPVRRVLFYVSMHGTVPDAWHVPGLRRGREDGEAPLDPAALSPILAPLAPFTDRLLVLEGVGNAAAIAGSALEGHSNGAATILSGGRATQAPGELPRPGGASVDQLVAATRDTPFPSLEWAVGGSEVAHDAGGRPLPLEEDPVRAWTRLGGGAADPGDGRAVALAAARTAALARKLGGADGATLSAQAERFSALEGRLAALAEARCGAVPGASPALPSPFGADDWPTEQLEAFFDLAAAAFACGLTDVITLRAGTVFNGTIGAPPGNLHLDYAHAVAHDPEAAAVMTDYHTWHAERVASLLARLDALPEGDGTVLDHTLVVWTSEMATGGHHFDELPVVLAGGTGVLRTGRVVRWAPRHEIAGPAPERIGVPHNRLLVALAQALGCDVDAVGERAFATADGEVDATGPLDRLFA